MAKTQHARAHARLTSVGIVLSALLSIASARADVLHLTPNGQKFYGVPLASGAEASVSGGSFALEAVGHGVRTKDLVINVYVAQLFMTDASQFVRTSDGALDSAAAMKGSAIRLDFLRSVDAGLVQSAFRDSLNANHVPLDAPEIQAFLAAVTQGGDAIRGKSLTLVFTTQPDGTDLVTYENSKGVATPIPGPKGFDRALLSIWLGITADSGTSNLKAALIKGSL